MVETVVSSWSKVSVTPEGSTSSDMFGAGSALLSTGDAASAGAANPPTARAVTAVRTTARAYVLICLRFCVTGRVTIRSDRW